MQCDMVASEMPLSFPFPSPSFFLPPSPAHALSSLFRAQPKEKRRRFFSFSSLPPLPVVYDLTESQEKWQNPFLSPPFSPPPPPLPPFTLSCDEGLQRGGSFPPSFSCWWAVVGREGKGNGTDTRFPFSPFPFFSSFPLYRPRSRGKSKRKNQQEIAIFFSPLSPSSPPSLLCFLYVSA